MNFTQKSNNAKASLFKKGRSPIDLEQLADQLRQEIDEDSRRVRKQVEEMA